MYAIVKILYKKDSLIDLLNMHNLLNYRLDDKLEIQNLSKINIHDILQLQKINIKIKNTSELKIKQNCNYLIDIYYIFNVNSTFSLDSH